MRGWMMSVCVWDKCSCTSGVSFDAENLITLTADRTSIPAVLASPFCPLSPGRPFSIKSSATQSPGSCPAAAIQVQSQSQSSAAVREGIEERGRKNEKGYSNKYDFCSTNFYSTGNAMWTWVRTRDGQRVC